MPVLLAEKALNTVSCEITMLWKLFPWMLAGFVITVGFYEWIETESLALFPLLGIWAWSIMWTHFVIEEVTRLNPQLPKNIFYKKVSFVLVLLLILAHPAIALTGLGLSLLNLWAIQIAIAALFLFLSFELFDRVRENSKVAKNWWLINISQSFAMIFIFIHSLNLGSHLQQGWFRTYWIILGMILSACIIHTHISDWKNLMNNNNNILTNDK